MDPASLLLPILLIAVFYFLLIRPQQKQRRKMEELQQSVVPGSRVMTGAGLLATVVALDGDEVVLEVAPGVTNRYVRRAIVNVVSETPAPAPMTNDPVADDTDVVDRPAEDRTNGDDNR
jgi:preprotein translocase subunit YajC